MEPRKRSSRSAKVRSQLYLDAITNFIHAETPDPKVQAEDRRILQRLRDCAERWHKESE
ncbi:MAG: hypothetical protein KZQ73_07495 [Candidatus Thiodiazotropha sp. (ex Semelilucina semeliformis)]|nr:hypothetical protein [Candidatus Thiodiazotropha sp. (ex Semelilucina semeliformis)]MCU7827664.1 hypothetical protein [Candidatus Thiodiazotropha sp. (ex Myrtea sp. 'scaly one' KF741663)]